MAWCVLQDHIGKALFHEAFDMVMEVSSGCATGIGPMFV